MSGRPPIERAFFREEPDGTIVFHPFGLGRAGYRLPDEATRERAARAASLWIGAILAIGTWTAHRLHAVLRPGAPDAGIDAVWAALMLPAAATGLAVLAYWLWATRFVERLAGSDHRPSREERLREAARQVAPWRVAAAGAATCGLSGLLVWLDPKVWWLGLAGAAVGVFLMGWSRALERAASSSP